MPFVVFIPKEGLVVGAPPVKPSFETTCSPSDLLAQHSLNNKFHKDNKDKCIQVDSIIWPVLHEKVPYVLSRCHIKRRMGVRGVFWYDTYFKKKLKSRCRTKKRKGAHGQQLGPFRGFYHIGQSLKMKRQMLSGGFYHYCTDLHVLFTVISSSECLVAEVTNIRPLPAV